MTDHDNSQGEPTMEEILASIRRIISEDNEESETAAGKPEVKGGPAAAGKGDSAGQSEAEVLELSPSQMVQEEKPAPAAEGKPNGLDTSRTEKPAAPVTEAARPAPRPEEPAAKRVESPVSAKAEETSPGSEVEETLLSPDVAAAAAAAFGALAKDATVSRSGDVHSLEELVKDMMKPMLKDWLDENLPPLVEEVVEREVRRLSHRRVRR